MPFRIRRKEGIEAGLKRILREQLDRAAENLLETEEADAAVAVHEARKGCKKARAVYRLLRPELETVYRTENARMRDLSRKLSASRDAKVMLDSFERILERFTNDIADRRDFATIRRRILRKQEELEHRDLDLEGQRGQCLAEIEEARLGLQRWSLPGEKFKLLGKGMRRTYGSGRRAMRRAVKEPTDENLHEWRKQAKYHCFHVRILRRMQPEEMGQRARETYALTELLGQSQDLSVLRRYLQVSDRLHGTIRNLAIFLELVDIRRQELLAEAVAVGQELFVPKPKELYQVWKKQWKRWRRDRE